MPMDIITFDRAQTPYKRRDPLITRGREEFVCRVKPEHIDETHETIARQQDMPASRHRNLARLHEMSGRWGDRKHTVEFVHSCPAGFDRWPNSRSCGLSVETAMFGMNGCQGFRELRIAGIIDANTDETARAFNQ